MKHAVLVLAALPDELRLPMAAEEGFIGSMLCVGGVNLRWRRLVLEESDETNVRRVDTTPTPYLHTFALTF